MMSKNKPISILVTGVGAATVGSQIVKALRLSKTPYKIVGTDMFKRSTGLQKVDSPYVIPSAKSKEFFSSLMKICKKEKVRCIIPGTEIELLKLSHKKNIIEEKGIFLLSNQYKLIRLCLDKGKLFEFLKKNQVKVPNFQVIKNIKDFRKIYSPVIIKPIKGSGSRSVFIAETNQEARFFIKYLIERGQKVIVQEYIGGKETEFTVGVLRMNKGKLKFSIALKRDLTKNLSCKESLKSKFGNKEFYISTGISQGYIDDYKDVRRVCEKISDILQAEGPLNIQCRKTRDGIVPFEINPRFSGTTSIRSLAGFNEPDMWINYLLFKKLILPKIRRTVVLRDIIEVEQI